MIPESGVADAPPKRGSAKILLVTTCWWPACARLAQLLRDAGCGVGVLCPTGHPARVIAGVSIFEQSAFRPVRALADAIWRFDPVFIVPGDERGLRTLHRLHGVGTDHERALIERSLGAPEHYAGIFSRSKILALAGTQNILTPEGAPVARLGALTAWMGTAPAPWVLKLSGSWGGMGVKAVTTRNSAAAAFRRLRGQAHFGAALFRMLVYRDAFWLADWLRFEPIEISVQRFISGHAGDLSMFCWEGEVLAMTMAETVLSLGENRPASMVRLIERADFWQAGTRLARAMRLSGFYGLDFIIETATDRAFLLEMNPRPTALSNIRLEPGRDLLGALVTALTGAPSVPFGIPDEALVAYFPLAWQQAGDGSLAQAHQDVPWHEPALMAEMLRPRWPERRFLARFLEGGRRMVRRLVAKRAGVMPGRRWFWGWWVARF